MKLTFCVVLSCLLASYVFSLPQRIITKSWGNVEGSTSDRVDIIVEPSLFKVTNYTFTYPEYQVFYFPFRSIIILRDIQLLRE